MVVIILFVFVYLVIFHFFPEIISKYIYKILLDWYIKILNIDIKIHGNEANLSRNRVLIMANHYSGAIDGGVIYKLYHKNNKNTICTIVKSNLVGDKSDYSYISSVLYYVKDYLMNSLHFIPYVRGDKEDGENVKNIITECLNNDKNVLIFPEGTTRINGIPKEFKTGIFRLAVEHQIDILPITIKYDKDIGTVIGKPLEHNKLFDTMADVYIHDIIDSKTSEYYKTNDFMGLKNKTFDIISSPFNLPEKEKEIEKEIEIEKEKEKEKEMKKMKKAMKLQKKKKKSDIV
jgi:1-acyl-sn-glycerol-3-phosphate acyltransferase